MTPTVPTSEAPPGLDMDLLRLSTAGSVDDGKSTLIGRLLLDTKQVLADQLAAVEQASRRLGHERTELALVTDGLRAEREQGITIDVAYRYFATPRRKFVVADTPGHEQYTRNMVTGASTSELAVVLVDARHGLTDQSRRHAALSTLLGIPHLVLAVNKMDLVGWSKQRFTQIASEFAEATATLGAPSVTAIPMSALHGDNVVDRSEATPWYEGPTLLDHLENSPLQHGRVPAGARLPVQWVIRPQSAAHPDYRGYAGQLAAGVLAPGDEVVVLPSGHRSTVAAIDTADGPLEAASAPKSVTVRLVDEIDVGRGDLIAAADDPPAVTRELDVTVAWMADRALEPHATYVLKQGTTTVRAVVDAVVDRLDMATLRPDVDVASLGLNDIGRVRLRTSAPLAVDPYERNRVTGGLILIDRPTTQPSAPA